MTGPVEIPPHVIELVQNWEKYTLLVRGLSCFGVVAVFYFPELMKLFTDRREVDNTVDSKRYLLDSGSFVKTGRGYGETFTWTAYSYNNPKNNWFEEGKIAHVHTHLGRGLVLAKSPWSGISRLQMVSSSSDLWEWFGREYYKHKDVTLSFQR